MNEKNSYLIAFFVTLISAIIGFIIIYYWNKLQFSKTNLTDNKKNDTCKRLPYLILLGFNFILIIVSICLLIIFSVKSA